jgi:hypothetical protein
MEMIKYKFKIMTRNQIAVDKLMIAGSDFESAKVKLEKMYPHCEILEYQAEQSATKKASFDDILDLITKD